MLLCKRKHKNTNPAKVTLLLVVLIEVGKGEGKKERGCVGEKERKGAALMHGRKKWDEVGRAGEKKGKAEGAWALRYYAIPSK
jgi:hypothetical protein